METLTIYLIKSSTLLLVFYSTYYFLLKKNTFFTTNRWFLLFGILCAAVLPLLSFQKTVWVEPAISNTQSINFEDISENPINVPSLSLVETTDISWEMIVGLLYGIGVLFFLTQLLIELYSLRKIIRKKNTIEADGFTFIEVDDAISPFSFFKKIVYNRNLFQPEELNNIIEHEKIHAKQLHSLDVLIARMHCILFWWNPLVWLYKKAMIQNLEFIADQNALSQIKDKKSYLLTLLKITTSEKQVPLVNHFYQSLIKKRILMLNTNQSKKYHSWKYLVVVPALVFFMLTYQVEVVAQEKEELKTNTDSRSTRVEMIIKSTSTDREINDHVDYLKDNFGIIARFNKISRTKNGAIKSIEVILTHKNGLTKNRYVSHSEPIKPFTIYVDTTEDKKITFGFDDARAYLLVGENIKNQKIVDSITEADSITNGTVKILNLKANFSVEINSNTTDESVNKYLNHLHNEFDLYLRIDKVKRNKQKEITKIKLAIINRKDEIKVYEVSGDDPIKPFTVFAGYDKNKEQLFGFGAISKNQHFKNHFEFLEKKEDKSTSQTNIFINRKGPLEETNELPEGVLMVLNGKVISKEEMQKLDANSIKSFTVVKRGSNKLKKYEELFKKYGESAKNGIFAIITEEIQKPVEKDNSGWGMDYKTSSPEDNIANIIENKTVDYKKALITLNGKEITAAEMEKINPKSIETVTVSGGVTNADFITMYGEKSRYGVIQIEKYGHKSPTSRDKNAIKGKDIILDPENGSFTIHRRSQKNDFKFYKKYLSQNDVELTISGVKRNAEGLITFINIQLIDTKNNQKIDSNGTAFENEKGIADISIGRKNGKMVLAPH
jgi:hypothetical protein